jgi:hypothetical protein
MSLDFSAERATRTYGARPVSVDLARGRGLTQPVPSDEVWRPYVSRSGLPLNHQAVADRLSLARWRPGHRIIVCSLDGGTGRTTVAGLLATVLAELPYAHIRRPIGLVEPSPRTLSTTARRWSRIGSTELGQCSAETPDREKPDAPSRVHILDRPAADRQFRDYSLAVMDAPAGMPSDSTCVTDDPYASVLLMIRPDRVSLADAAEALVWMNDQCLVPRQRVTVIINQGAGPADRGTKAAITALGIRCAAIHSLQREAILGPGRALPSGRALPTHLRRRIARICLDIWTQSPKHQLPLL